MTDSQIKDTVNTNIIQAKEILRRINFCNKGRYVHDLNSGSHKLTYAIQNVENKEITDLNDEEFLNMCKIKQNMAAILFYANNNI
jgi:hypothetical protein